VNRRNLFIFVVILVLAVGGFFVIRQMSAGSSNTTANLQTADVQRGTVAAAVNGAGTMAAPQSATLAWRTAGVVSKVHVSVGDVVNRGDTLMELDLATLDNSVIQAQADLISAQQALDTLLAGPTEQQLAQARLNVVQAEQAVTTAQRNLNNVLNPVGQALFDSVTAAQVAYDTAQANSTLEHVSADASAVQTAENTMNTAYSQLQRAQTAYDDCIKISCAERPQRENALTNAQNAYQTAQNNYGAAKLQYDTKVSSLSYNLDTAKTAFDRAKANLAAAQAGPDPATVKLYQAQLDLAKANLVQIQSDLAKLQAAPDPKDVVAAKAKLTAAQATVNSATLVAPFDGTVLAVDNHVGDSVASAQTAIVIADLSSFDIEVNVSEVDINRIAIGQEVNLTVDAALGQTFKGQVSAVLAMGTSQQGVVTFPVTIVVPNPDPALKPGMTAAVAIITDQHTNVLMVPNRAIHASGGQRTVTVLFEGQQITVPITVGLSDETQSEVTDGTLREGDTVLLSQSAATLTNQAGGGGLFGLFGGGGGRGGP
jgi:HlyD family secretion protein